MNCDLCSQKVKIEGDTTRYYVGLEAEENKKLMAALEIARKALGQTSCMEPFNNLTRGGNVLVHSCCVCLALTAIDEALK